MHVANESLTNPITTRLATPLKAYSWIIPMEHEGHMRLCRATNFFSLISVREASRVLIRHIRRQAGPRSKLLETSSSLAPLPHTSP